MLVRNFLVVFCITFCIVAPNHAQDDKSEMGAILRLLKNLALNQRTSNFTSLDIFPDFLIDGFDLENENSTNTCLRDLFRVAINLREMWTLKMIDSDAKPGSGLLKGNFKWPGDYDECLDVFAPPMVNSSNNSGFHGRYCTIGWAVNLMPGNYTNMTQYSQLTALSTGVCVPHTCDSTILMNYTGILYNLFSPFLSSNSTNPFGIASISCKPLTREWDASAIVVLFILSFFGLLVVLGTGITVSERLRPKIVERIESRDDTESAFDSRDHLLPSTKEESELKRYLNGVKACLQCFCVLTNGERLMRTQKSDTHREDLRCIHGIRFLSMCWVILGHTYAFAFLGTVRNLMDISHISSPWLFQFILQGPFSVDSFFVMSGFLLAYIFLKQITDRDGKMSWPYFYIHRYWRLTPVYAIVLAFDATISKYLSSGPFWSEAGTDTNCEHGWWWNLLYINNFADAQNQCMSWSWYLANDMQFYVISPMFLYPLWRWPLVGLGILLTLLTASWITTAIITYHFNLLAGYAELSQLGTEAMKEALNFAQRMSEYFMKYYIKPYTRIGPYLIGALVGFIVYKYTQKLVLKPAFRVLGWLLSFAFFAISIFVLYHVKPDPIGSTFYNTLIRSVFAIALAWVIFACLSGYGGYINSFLSLDFFVPLGRLTYCAYLVHPIVMGAHFQSMRTTLYLSHPTMIVMFFGFLVASYGAALVTSLVFEAPLLLLEKRLIKTMGLTVN